MTFYEVLKPICKKKHTSPTAVALAIGMSKSNVSRWKNGEMPKLGTVIKIAEHLGVTPESVLTKYMKDAEPMRKKGE